jgi:hypothetical protein
MRRREFITFMLRPAYLTQKLAGRFRPKITARCAPASMPLNYILALPDDRAHRSQWQRAAGLLLDEAGVAAATHED